MNKINLYVGCKSSKGDDDIDCFLGYKDKILETKDNKYLDNFVFYERNSNNFEFKRAIEELCLTEKEKDVLEKYTESSNWVEIERMYDEALGDLDWFKIDLDNIPDYLTEIDIVLKAYKNMCDIKEAKVIICNDKGKEIENKLINLGYYTKENMGIKVAKLIVKEGEISIEYTEKEEVNFDTLPLFSSSSPIRKLENNVNETIKRILKESVWS